MAQIKRIVAAIDLSDCSAVALSYAASIARRCDAELTLLHVNTIAPLVEGVPANLGYTMAYQLDGARAALDEFSAKHVKDVSVSRRVVTGLPPEVILSTSRAGDADLIVMGTRGASGIKRMVLGSVAEAVIRQSDRPVLTVRCSMTDVQPEDAVFRRILCPVDYGENSKRAFAQAVALASAFDADVAVVYVADETRGVVDMETEIDRLRKWIGDVTPAVRTKLLIDRGNAAAQVMSYVNEHAVDLLVIGARKKSDEPQTVLGATTETLTRHAACPVLTVPAPAAGAMPHYGP